MPPQAKFIIGAVGVFVVIMLVLALTPFTIVDAGQRAVILRLGKVDRVLDPGLHWVTPLIENVQKIDVQTNKDQIDASAASLDLQNVTTTIAVNYNIDPQGVGLLWANVGENYKSKIIDPAIQEAIKAATAKYTAEQLVTKREEARFAIEELLRARLQSQNIVVGSVSIVNFKFSDQFEQAIENKVTAEQNAQTAKNNLVKIQFEADQRIAQARGEAEAIRIQAQAVNSQGGADYVALQKIKAWDGKACTSYCGIEAMSTLLSTK